MPKLIWDAVGERYYENGVDHGVLYPLNSVNNTYDSGVAWNGLVSVSESPSGGESNAQYADNIKYLDLLSKEDFGATIECFTYPKEWELCDGTVSPVEGMTIGQQSRKTFGLSYRTKIGNDITDDLGYKLHLIYGCKAQPSERAYNTVNDSPEALQFSYTISTTPVDVPGYKATSQIVIDSTKFVSTEAKERLANLEAILYGTDGTVTYNEFSGSTFEAGVVYYERSGVEGSYVYTPTTDTEPDSEKTYYTKTETGATTPRLPMPAEVITILGGVING